MGRLAWSSTPTQTLSAALPPPDALSLSRYAPAFTRTVGAPTPPTAPTNSSRSSHRPTELGQDIPLASNTIWFFVGVVTGWTIAMAAVWINYLQARNG
jgi:hypothetical protein